MKSTELEIISKACACRSFLYIAGFLTDVESEKIHGKIRKYQDKHRQNVSTDDLASVRIVMEEGSCTLGVGEGSGNMFVHGDYESIKHLQGKLLQMEVDKQRIKELEAQLVKVVKPIHQVTLLGDDMFEYPSCECSSCHRKVKGNKYTHKSCWCGTKPDWTEESK